jgi:hypothetical protein
MTLCVVSSYVDKGYDPAEYIMITIQKNKVFEPEARVGEFLYPLPELETSWRERCNLLPDEKPTLRLMLSALNEMEGTHSLKVIVPRSHVHGVPRK